MDNTINLLGVYFLIAIVVNGFFALRIVNARSGNKFNYTFNDLRSIMSDLTSGVLEKIPRYNGGC